MRAREATSCRLCCQLLKHVPQAHVRLERLFPRVLACTALAVLMARVGMLRPDRYTFWLGSFTISSTFSLCRQDGSEERLKTRGGMQRAERGRA